jgi:hypothetical protein
MPLIELTVCIVKGAHGKNLLEASLAPKRLEWRVPLLVEKAEEEKEARRVAQDLVPKDHSEVVDPMVRKDQEDRKDQGSVKGLVSSSARASVVKASHVPTHTSLVVSREENQGPKPLLLDHRPRSR